MIIIFSDKKGGGLMEYPINQIIDYYGRAAISFVNVITNKVNDGQIQANRRTARGVSGLVIPLSGVGTFTFNGTLYKLDSQTVLHAGSYMQTDIQSLSENEWSYAVIHYKVHKKQQLSLDLSDADFPIRIGDCAQIQQLTRQLIEHYSTPGAMAAFQVKASFMKLLEEILLQTRDARYFTKNQIVNKAINFIHNHYNRPILVSEIAQTVQLERRKLSYLFERYTGLSPIQYITEYRIRKAKELLIQSNDPVAKVAEHVGYPDSFYFSRVFKKVTGMSPVHYRKCIKEHSI